MASMKKEIKEQWIKALRSGEYRQARGKLCKVNGKGNKSFCCLGVLTDLAIKSGEVDGSWRIYDTSYMIYDTSNVLLSRNIIKWAGMNGIDTDGETYYENCSVSSIVLATKNDKGASFKQIANIIDKYIEGV